MTFILPGFRFSYLLNEVGLSLKNGKITIKINLNKKILIF
jgi:hypothetical protein